MATFSLQVSYAQIAVFDSALSNPFNDWTERHVRQGFAWRPGSVSFATLENAGSILVRVRRLSTVDADASTAERIIAVPFSVASHGEIEIASISDSVKVALPPGEYELTFEHGQDSRSGMWANVYFRRVESPVAATIIRADPALAPESELLMTAQPA